MQSIELSGENSQSTVLVYKQAFATSNAHYIYTRVLLFNIFSLEINICLTVFSHK